MTSDSFPPSCRVLVVAYEPSHASSIVEQVIAASRQEIPEPQTLDDFGGGGLYGWSIENKYYTAPVHFLAQTPSLPPAKPLWPPQSGDEKAPAIVFAFVGEEAVQQQFLRITDAFEAHDAEIRIAVRLKDPEGDRLSPETREELSEFFQEHAFEFVNLEDEPGEDDDDDSVEEELPPIPRIINALSTIMWPSMVRKPTTRPNIARLQQDIAEGGFLDSDLAAGLSSAPTPIPPSTQRSASPSLFFDGETGFKNDELDALEAWLDGDPDAPWKGTPLPKVDGGSENEVAAGFDDDFDAFVSAQTPLSQPSDPAALLPTPANDEEWLPSQREVQDTARKIFGRSVGRDEPVNAVDGEDMDEEALGHFDLSEVLGVLQSMKEEVAGIQDSDAKRRAAARIALGFAAGLGLPSDADDFNHDY